MQFDSVHGRWERDIQAAGITVWGAALDTLENTSRFAKGSTTGPMAVLHLFDQPLKIARPFEGYMGNLVLPRDVVEQAVSSLEFSLLAQHAHNLAQLFHRLYHAHPVVPEDDDSIRALRRAVFTLFVDEMGVLLEELLGIPIPEEM